MKCLTALFNKTSQIYISKRDFVETDDNRIFYWFYGEAAGYKEDRLYFYKGGIVYFRDYNEPDYSSRDEDGSLTSATNEKYVVFYRKET